ncbi:MFS general substrate transporter [Periconia macrospinosa]|uniref:MFS general substrate transporter n=1 Tax=Periconia macrospinosa TaxID=97972 RepID=A0A2V1E306_9PLEO|nr:MFS general substrate transporter [Periconia macrospinosa]
MGIKNKKFARLSDDEHLQDDRSFYGHASLDVADQMSYEAYRSNDKVPLVEMTKDAAEHNENNAPLRQALKQYSRIVWWCLATATAILYGGYDSGVLSAAITLPAFARDFGDEQPFDPSKPEEQWLVPAKWLSLWEGIGPLGQLVGAILGGWLLDKIGRKLCLLMGSIIGVVGILLFVSANKPADKDSRRIMILLAKVVQGFGLGIIKIETFTYLSEVVPVSLKGAVFALVPIFTLLGQLMGGIVGFVSEKNDTSMSYVITLGSQLIVALPSFTLSIFLPESPAYLLNKNNSQGALASLRRLLGPKNDAHAAMVKLEHTITEEKKMSGKARYIDTFRGTNIRRTLIIMFASSIEILWGLPLLGTVSLYLKVLGLPASYALLFQIAGIIVGLIANIGSAWTLSHIGRRKLTYVSFLITACLWTAMGFSGIKQSKVTPWISGGIMTGVVSVCGLGAWPASYAIQGETSTLRLRAKSQAIGSLTNSLLNMGAGAILPYIFNKDAGDAGAKTGFVFTATCVIGAAATFFFVPELKGRSAEEIDQLFEKRVSSIKSAKWQNTAQEPLRRV